MKFDQSVISSLTQNWSLERHIRVRPMAHAATPLGVGFGKTRFASPDDSFKVLYIAPLALTAIAETLIRDRFADRVRRRILQEEVEDWGATEVGTARPLRLIDLRGMGPTLLGIPTDALLARNQRAGRRMSADAFATFKAIRWAETEGAPVCPRCGGLKIYDLTDNRRFKCASCLHKFSVTSGNVSKASRSAWWALVFASEIFRRAEI